MVGEGGRWKHGALEDTRQTGVFFVVHIGL